MNKKLFTLKMYSDGNKTKVSLNKHKFLNIGTVIGLLENYTNALRKQYIKPVDKKEEK